MGFENKIPILIAGVFASRGVEIADLAADISDYVVQGFIEINDRDRCSDKFEGLPVYWVEELRQLSDGHHVVCAGSSEYRQHASRVLADYNATFAQLIHPSASVSQSVGIGPGAVINRHVAIAVHARVGQHAFINRGSTIGHHTEIGAFASIRPGVHIGGQAKIGERVKVGIGATIIDRVKLGPGCSVCAGAVVTKDVADGVTVAGMPARTIRTDPTRPIY